MTELAQRRGGTSGRRAERAGAPLIQKRYITREIPLFELVDAAGIDLNHEESMNILEEIGIDLRDEYVVIGGRHTVFAPAPSSSCR